MSAPVTHLLYLHGFRSSPQSTKAKKFAAWVAALGGFYATAVAERRGCRAVLLNPGVDPARDLAAAVGATTTWHGDEPFEFRAEYLDELRAIAPPATLTDPDRYLAVIAKGDEVLSWREMSARYAGAHIRLIEGSDHALSDFDEHFPAVLAFLGRAGAGVVTSR